jgi:alkylation response protein AidB-like acyl-CoA dehydrogenase
VEFTFSDDQEALRAAVRRFVEERLPIAVVRRLADEDAPFPDDLWQEMAGLGWTGLLVGEEHGGLGLGLVDLVVLQEELGRVPVGGPWFSSAVFATLAARHLRLDDRLAGLASGSTRGTVALEELGHGDPVDRVRTRAVREAGRWLLTGSKPVVLDGDTADWVLVVARTNEGLGTFAVEGPGAEAVPSWDVTRRVTRLALDQRPAEPVGPAGDQTAIWRRIADDASVALCAELIGVGEQAIALAVEYAKVRVQFGRPIATFQVIKHKAVDMLHRLELARVGTHYAAWAADVEAPDRARASAMAKGYVAEAANFVCAEAIQIHGGVGFTWDCDAHLLYRRAKQDDLMLGYSGWQRQRLADLVLSA